MAVFLLLGLALIFLFVCPMAITYLIASFINEVILKRSNSPKLYLTIAFIFSFMFFLLFPPIQHFAAEDAYVFLACVLVLGIGMIFSIAYLMQQKYRAKISDEARFFIGVVVASVLSFALIILNPGLSGVIWMTSLVNTEIWMTSIEKYAIESWLLVAVWMWTLIGLKSKYWRAFVGYILFIFSVPCLICVACSIAIKISSEPLFLAELLIKGRYFLDLLSFGLFPFILLLIGIYIADEKGFIKRVKEYLTRTFQKKERDDEAYGEKRYEESYKREKEAKTEPVPYYYRVLGVSKTATPDEIKSAYRRLAKLYHPDRGADPDTEKKFKEIQKTYEVLSDSDKRAQYDRFEDSYNE